MLVIKKFEFNPFSENTYIVWDEVTLETAVVDPGCIDAFEQNELDTFIKENDLKVKYLLVTHSHLDHILGCKYIKEKYSPEYYAPGEDMPLLQNAGKQASTFGMEIDLPPVPDKYLNEELTLTLGEWEMKALFTPGHTPGEFCLYFPAANFCISGDVLFKGSIGRTDLWGGDYQTLINSIQSKLFTLPGDTIVYPGHGERTSIGEEKKNNPFIKE